MISKHKIKYKDGTVKTNVRIVEGYRPSPGAAPKQRQIKNLGYAEDYEDQEAFWKMVEEEERKFKESKETIAVNLDASLTLNDAKRELLGYKYLDTDGMIRTGEILLDILARKRFNQVLQRHVELPYTKWWQSQDDPFILSKKPEILDKALSAKLKKKGA